MPDMQPSEAPRQVSRVGGSSGVHVRGTEAELASNAPVAAPPALRASVRQLMILRTIAVTGQAAAIATAWFLGVSLPVAAMALVVGAVIVLIAAAGLVVLGTARSRANTGRLSRETRQRDASPPPPDVRPEPAEGCNAAPFPLYARSFGAVRSA